MAGTGTGTPLGTGLTTTTWNLAQIRSTARDLIGEHLTGNLSNATIDGMINEYYTDHFPEESGMTEFQTDLTQDVTPTDSGEYSLAQTVIAVEEPVTLDGKRIQLLTDKEQFFNLYPEDEDYITPPTLAIGTSDTAAVANSAFKYSLGGYSYSKAAAETSLSGDAVPANKYGAWMLTIDEDGTITVTESEDNATGYASPGQAIADLDHSDDEAVMGYVTIISTAIFTPGTTALNDAAVTATFTDGRADMRGCPEAVLVYGGKLFVRPRSDDWHRVEAQMSLQRPSALSADASEPLDEKWGRLLAVGAAILYLNDQGDTTRVSELSVVKDALLKSVQRKQLIQWIRDQRTAQPTY